MRFVNFSKSGTATLGVNTGEAIVDLSIAAPELPGNLVDLLEQGEAGLEAVRKAVAHAPAAALVPLEGLTYLPPIERPGKIVCVGANYRAHAAEATYELPGNPVYFGRYYNSFVAHGQPLIRPKVSEQFDYEGELAVVIGRRGRHISLEDAHDYVAGYAAFNDGSIRDYQFKSDQWIWGKTFDGTGGFGPELVTADELPAGAIGLSIKTVVNGVVVQDANTADMIFSVAQIISSLSEAMTLEPGDVIATGTPAGVGIFHNPPLWLKDGDTCEVIIEGVGHLSNPVRNEQ